MKLGATLAVVMGVAGCSAGAGGDGGDDPFASSPGGASYDDETQAAQSAAGACPSVSTTLDAHVSAGRATVTVVPFFFLTFRSYYGAGPRRELLGSDGNQVVALYRLADGSYTANASLCTATPICGDGVATGGENCDGTDFRGTTCADHNFLGGGSLTCNVNCMVETGSCRAVCGNGVHENTEHCDPPGGSAYPGHCSDDGSGAYVSGEVTCGSDCQADYSACRGPVCGDGKLELWEQCDAGNPGIFTECSQMSDRFIGGQLGCNSECLYDTSPCQTGCGDGQVGPYEACDGAARNSYYAGKACKDIPFPFPTWPFWGTVFYSGGALSCESDCDISMAACKAPGFACYIMGQRVGVPIINCFDPGGP